MQSKSVNVRWRPLKPISRRSFSFQGSALRKNMIICRPGCRRSNMGQRPLIARRKMKPALPVPAARSQPDHRSRPCRRLRAIGPVSTARRPPTPSREPRGATLPPEACQRYRLPASARPGGSQCDDVLLAMRSRGSPPRQQSAESALNLNIFLHLLHFITILNNFTTFNYLNS